MHYATPAITPTHQTSQNEILDAIQRGESYIYALATRDGAIKIGVTSSLAKRKHHIGYGGTLKYLAFTPGDYDDEQAIHARMRDEYRVADSREYYYPVKPEVLAPINQMRSTMGLGKIYLRHLPQCGWWGRRLPRPTRSVSWHWPDIDSKPDVLRVPSSNRRWYAPST